MEQNHSFGNEESKAMFMLAIVPALTAAPLILGIIDSEVKKRWKSTPHVILPNVVDSVPLEWYFVEFGATLRLMASLAANGFYSPEEAAAKEAGET